MTIWWNFAKDKFIFIPTVLNSHKQMLQKFFFTTRLYCQKNWKNPKLELRQGFLNFDWYVILDENNKNIYLFHKEKLLKLRPLVYLSSMIIIKNVLN